MVDLIQILLIISNVFIVAGMFIMWRMLYRSGRQLNREINKLQKPFYNEQVGVS